MSVPSLPETAPFSPEQRAWLNGFLAGLFSRQPGAAGVAAPAPAALTPLTILFASQTGTAESLAKKAAKEAGKRGFAPAILDVATVSAESLQAHSNLLFITSTYGDGEPPDNAANLHAALVAPDAPKLESVNFAVLALGDSNYPDFCKCGRDFHERLAALGAKPLIPIVECDVDYDKPFSEFAKQLERSLGLLAAA